MTSEKGTPTSVAETGSDSSRIGALLTLWIVLILGFQAAFWLSGARPRALADAVERGVLEVELKSYGEVQDYLIHKAIQTQRRTLAFWTTLALIADFVITPLGLVLRAVAVATLLSGLAALTGRPARFGLALAECVWVQGLWVFALGLRVALCLALRRTDVDVSLALALPPGTYPAWNWALLAQVDPFALWGWTAMAWGGWRRGQANLAASTLTCLLVALAEMTLWISATLVAGAAMRLTLFAR